MPLFIFLRQPVFLGYTDCTEMLRSLFRKIRKSRFAYEPLIEVTIFADRILHNLHAFREKYGIAVAPVLKSNAYGHGLKEVGAILKDEPLPFLCVDSYHEALSLRNENVATPILILAYTSLKNILASKLPHVSFAIISLEELTLLSSELQKTRSFHLEIDTGMHRHGIRASELHTARDLLLKNPHIRLEGIYSHFADAGNPDAVTTHEQIRAWHEAKKRFTADIFPHLRYYHLAATAGSFYSKEIEANVMRLGLGLYGGNAHQNEDLKLLPALRLETVISSLSTVQQGERIGYGGTYEAPETKQIATIPMGYNEGIDRRLSNKGIVTVRGIPCPILGRVSMNISTIDVSGVPQPRLGERVVVISENASDPNSAEHIAHASNVIPYETLVHLPTSLRRTVR